MSEKKTKKRISTKTIALQLLLKLLLIVLIFFVLFRFVFDITVVSGNQMFPAIKDGDLAISYRLEPYSINDAVIYEAPDGTKRIGRVIARGGDEIEISEIGALTVNGYAPSEEIFYPTIPGNAITYPYTVPADSVFLLNDFRSSTDDSREYGAIDQSKIHGHLIFIIRRRGF